MRGGFMRFRTMRRLERRSLRRRRFRSLQQRQHRPIPILYQRLYLRQSCPESGDAGKIYIVSNGVLSIWNGTEMVKNGEQSA